MTARTVECKWVRDKDHRDVRTEDVLGRIGRRCGQYGAQCTWVDHHGDHAKLPRCRGGIGRVRRRGGRQTSQPRHRGSPEARLDRTHPIGGSARGSSPGGADRTQPVRVRDHCPGHLQLPASPPSRQPGRQDGRTAGRQDGRPASMTGSLPARSRRARWTARASPGPAGGRHHRGARRPPPPTGGRLTEPMFATAAPTAELIDSHPGQVREHHRHRGATGGSARSVVRIGGAAAHDGCEAVHGPARRLR
jgi:hypothetical protein